MKQYGRSAFYLKILPQSQDILLDIGCDTGEFTKIYLQEKKAKTAYGLDVNPDLISKANVNLGNENLKYFHYNGNIFPFEDNSFDLITATEVLEHVENENLFLSELYRVLKPKGKVLLSVPHKGLFDFLDVFNFRFLFPQKIFNYFYKKIKGKEPILDPVRTYHRHYNKNNLLSLCEYSHFKAAKLYRRGLLFFYLTWIFNDLIFPKSQNKIFVFLRNTLNILADWEYSLNFGPFAANMVCILEK
jgi:ubiquinone/menaquinone biosynthesis C-methylase UbiE